MPTLADVTLQATADVRTSLTGQYFLGASFQAHQALTIEAKLSNTVLEIEQVAHRSYVIGAVMQAAAALECESWEVFTHGPGHHLGSNGTDFSAKSFFSPIAEIVEREPPLERYRVVLHLLGKAALSKGRQPWADAALVMHLRNELVHFKSRWGSELTQKAWLKALRDKKHKRAPFLADGITFFPYAALSAGCAEWAVQACIQFLDGFYERLGFPGRLDPYRSQFRLPTKAPQRSTARIQAKT